MKKILLICFLSFFIPLFLTNCSKDVCNCVTETESSQKDVILPLVIGNNWIYKINTYDSLGVLTSAEDNVWTVLADSTINNEKWFDVKGWKFAGKNFSDGLYFGNYDSTTFLSGISIKYPVTKGTSYYAKQDNDSLLMSVLSIDTLITVPAGTFSCYKYKYTTSYTIANVNYYRDYNLYFSPKTGLICEEVYNYIDGISPILHIRWELQSFTLK